MPLQDDQIEEVASSNTSALDEQNVEQAQKPVATSGDAASSPATGEEDKDLLSVVRDAVDKSKPETSAASPAEGEEDEGSSDQPKKIDNENFSDVPFNNHPRFRALLKSWREEKQDAERYRNVQTFLDTHGVSPEEASDALIIAGLAKTNPAEAWKQIKPWVQKVLVAAGEVLPDDLQQRVQAGEFTAEAALEISRHRATAQSVQAQQSFREQQALRQQQIEATSSITNAAVEWEQDRRLKDPNFDTKLVPLQKEIAYLHATEGKPTTAEGVRDQLRRAYKAVNSAFVAPTPALPTARPKPAINPVRGGNVAGNAQPSEMSTLDIVRQHTRRQ